MKPFRIALAIALVVQLVFVADYYRLTDGCFCAVLAAGRPVHRVLPGELLFLRAVSFPSQVLPVSFPQGIRDTPRTVLYTVLNTIVWFSMICIAALAMRHLRRPGKQDGPSSHTSVNAG